MFGNPETTSGGLALKYYASVRMEVFLKDVEIIRKFAHDLSSPTPLFATSAQLYEAAMAQGRVDYFHAPKSHRGIWYRDLPKDEPTNYSSDDDFKFSSFNQLVDINIRDRQLLQYSTIVENEILRYDIEVVESKILRKPFANVAD